MYRRQQTDTRGRRRQQLMRTCTCVCGREKKETKASKSEVKRVENKYQLESFEGFPSPHSVLLTNYYCYLVAVRAFDSHSIASSRPSPLMAEVLKIWNVRFLSTSRPSSLCTSATVRAFSMSCLFASTTRMALFSSSSCVCDRNDFDLENAS